MRVFLARDPGGANVIAPLFRACPGPKVLWAKDYAREVFQRAGLAWRDFNAEAADRPLAPGGTVGDGNEDPRAVAAWLGLQQGATLLVTGTGNVDDFTERLAWDAAARAGIPTIAVIDQWVRPIERFRWKGSMHRPDFIVTPSAEAASRLEAAGCCRRRTLSLGHIHLRHIAERRGEAAAAREKARAWLAGRLGHPIRRVLTYASEPFRFLAQSGSLFPDIPYDEIQVFRMVKEALARSGLEDCLLVAKLHPKEDRSAFEAVHDCVIKDELTGFEAICASDLVVGLKGMFLIESVVLGKAVYSLDLHPSPDERLVTNALGLSQPARDVSGLASQFRAFPAYRPLPEGGIDAALGLGGDALGPYLKLMAEAEASADASADASSAEG